MPSPVTVLETADAAAALLHPVRRRLLELLQTPDSATGVARRMGLPRQRVRYHVRELEELGLVDHVEDRRKGNCVEKVVQSRAVRYVIAPEVLGALGLDPAAVRDRFSSTYLVAVATRAARDVAALQESAAAAGKKLPTLTLQADVGFGSAREQNAFAEELSQLFARLVAKYQGGASSPRRRFRFLMAGYPAPPQEGDIHAREE